MRILFGFISERNKTIKSKQQTSNIKSWIMNKWESWEREKLKQNACKWTNK